MPPIEPQQTSSTSERIFTAQSRIHWNFHIRTCTETELGLSISAVYASRKVRAGWQYRAPKGVESLEWKVGIGGMFY